MEKTALELKAEETYKAYRELLEAIEEEKKSVIIPELKLKYEGKYFKTKINNSIIYAFVKQVLTSKTGQIHSFICHKSFNGEIIGFEFRWFEPDHMESMDQQEITKEEFVAAFDATIASVSFYRK